MQKAFAIFAVLQIEVVGRLKLKKKFKSFSAASSGVFGNRLLSDLVNR